ncbi:UPF0161 protein At3g09310 isoform X2 [Mercurialis annua]|uniref:UPF0161 protein At3g09310 isoform X2 n=1 Tax=Mercurialis annua TaxID=3986 RepID=UPI00215F0B80|nr:UPF0161 protein At3g09310 isoform X2 [Mercurialis annua]
MALSISFNNHKPLCTNNFKTLGTTTIASHSYSSLSFTGSMKIQRPKHPNCSNKLDTDSAQNTHNQPDEGVDSLGVKAALSILRFYKREISPVLPRSCRYVPTCSEYSMIAYKKYGFVKGSALTVWRICRCNPLGGSGFDPPRWFDEETPPQE